MIIYEKEYRNTRYGGLTKNIAICLECKKVIKPTRLRLSRSGTHGTEYYVHEHQLYFITLIQSNSGNRSIVVPEKLNDVEVDLERMWIYEGCSVNDVINYLIKYLEKS